jgi:hypothetical protein
MWEFQGVRQLAIEQLTDKGCLLPIDKVELGIKFEVKDWIKKGALELVKQPKLSVTMEEAEHIGLSALRNLFTAREELLSQARGNYNNTYGYYNGSSGSLHSNPLMNITDQAQSQVIEQCFQSELSDLPRLAIKSPKANKKNRRSAGSSVIPLNRAVKDLCILCLLS